MKKLANLSLTVVFLMSILGLTACGTYTPIPAHGGGKRFATEQMLISAVTKKAIADLPLHKLQGKKIILETSIIYDEGGGYINGGRSFSTEAYSVLGQKPAFTPMPGDPVKSSKGWSIGTGSAKVDHNYAKDLTFASSDGKHLVNSIISAAIRNNVYVNPGAEDGAPDYLLEILVDTLGTIRSRTDWLLKNSEQLKAVISIEYVITPLTGAAGVKRLLGSISYEAEYTEEYAFWMGPVDTKYSIKKVDWSHLISNLGDGINQFDNLRKDYPKDGFQGGGTSIPVQINPRIK